MGIIRLNLFPLIPSKSDVELCYIPIADNKLVNRLRRLGFHAASMPSTYSGLEKGTYFECKVIDILNEQKISNSGMLRECIDYINEVLNRRNIEYKPISISSSAYIMKYIVQNSILSKINELIKKNIVTRKKSGFGNIIFCRNEPIELNGKLLISRPHSLLEAHKCYRLRVQHINGKLFLQINTYISIHANLGLSKILSLIAKIKVSINKESVIGLPVRVYVDERLMPGYISDIELNTRHVENTIVTVVTPVGSRKVTPGLIELSLRFYRVLKFLEDVLNENVSEFIRDRHQASLKSPLTKINEINSEDIHFIKEHLFPIRVLDVEYDVDTKPLTITIPDIEPGTIPY